MSSFSFVSRNFFISFLISFLTHSLFSSMLFNLCDFECFWDFSLSLVSRFIPLWSEEILHMISIVLNVLRLLLGPILWSIFENVPCAFENNVYLLLWDERLYIYQLSPFHLGHCSMSQCLCRYSVWKICPFLTVGC